MSCTIRVRVRSGILEPLEPVPLAEGQEVTVTILEVPSVPDMEAFRRSAGGWAGTFNAETLIRRIYEDRLLTARSLPSL